MSKLVRTIDDLIRNDDYEYIEIREIYVVGNTVNSIFVGKAASKNGELISLDGDSYSKDMRVFDYHYWGNAEKNIKIGLTVRVYPGSEVKEMKNCDLVTCTACENGKCTNRGYEDSCPYAKCKKILEDIREYVDGYERKTGK